jgi:hypothetical protein
MSVTPSLGTIMCPMGVADSVTTRTPSAANGSSDAATR